MVRILKLTFCLIFRIKFFRAGHEVGQRYSGERTLENFRKVIQEELMKVGYKLLGESLYMQNFSHWLTVLQDGGSETPKVRGPLHALAELTDDTFDDFISVGKHFVKMYAPWCGHCQVCFCSLCYHDYVDSYPRIYNQRIMNWLDQLLYLLFSIQT